MVHYATFSNISAILWWAVLLVQAPGVPKVNHRPAATPWQTLEHYVTSSTPHCEGFFF